MVVDKYVSRCLDVGSTPTGSIIFKKRRWDYEIETLSIDFCPTAFLKYNGAGGSRTHVQTPANIFVYNHRLCIILTAPRHITQA